MLSNVVLVSAIQRSESVICVHISLPCGTSPLSHPSRSSQSTKLNEVPGLYHSFPLAVYLHMVRQWHPTPVLLPGKSHGRRSLVGCSPWVTKSWTRLSDFSFHFHALEKEMATHSSVLAWRIPGMEEPGGPLSMGSHRVGHD